MYVVESDGRMVVIDCGITFPKNDQMGVDIVLPDFSYVLERADALEAIVPTHGHEDHIGAVPFLLRAVGQVPVYGRRCTASPGNSASTAWRSAPSSSGCRTASKVPVGPFEAEFIPITHSQYPTARPWRCAPRRARSPHRRLRDRVRPGGRPPQRRARVRAPRRPRRPAAAGGLHERGGERPGRAVPERGRQGRAGRALCDLAWPGPRHHLPRRTSTGCGRSSRRPTSTAGSSPSSAAR